LVVEAVTYGHPACHRRPGTIEYRLARPRHPGRAGTCLTQLVSVGHDFGIEIDGFRFPGI